jgi:prophage tail gpP-like protein
VDAASANQRAAWEKTVRAARCVTVSVTVQGFRQGGQGNTRTTAPLWQINALTDVDIPFLRLRQQLVASKVTFRRDASSGSTTVLELKDIDSFRPQPRQQAATAAAQGDYSIETEKDLQTRSREQADRQHGQIKEGRP